MEDVSRNPDGPRALDGAHSEKLIATPESGGIEEVARRAPPGAVTIAPFGDDFGAAMGQVRPSSPTAAPHPSLLPRQYDARTIASAFATILDELV